MDDTIANWIIEFLLRQKVDDNLINALISSLPVARQDYRFKKTMLLRRMETEISNGCVSDTLLELIEIVEALDSEHGQTASDLMKGAYCLVAVDCTVRFLEETTEENQKYLETVEILWRNRVCKSEGLVSETSKKWLEDIELAWKDSSVCEKIWMRNTRNEALRAVKAYLREAWECLGPSFLELVAAKAGKEVEELRSSSAAAAAAAGSSGGGGDVGGGDDAMPSANPITEMVAFEGTRKGETQIRRKHVATKKRRPSGAKISDVPEAMMNETCDSIPESATPQPETPEVDKAKEAISSSPTKPSAVGQDHHSNYVGIDLNLSSAVPNSVVYVVEAKKVGPEVFNSNETIRIQRELRNSSKELHAVVNDPLPEALRAAQTLISSLSTNNQTIPVTNGLQNGEMRERTVLNTESEVGPSEHVGTEMGASKVRNEKDAENGGVQGTEVRGRKRSLMEASDTSHTYQWHDDEIENSPESPPGRRLPPTPKVHRVSPLNVPGYRQGRRERKRWTPLEEETLRKGVLDHGRGCWKTILLDTKYREIFQGRTEVDLKDKWRNMTKYP